MNVMDFLPGAYGAFWFLTAKGLYRPMMRRNIEAFQVGKWCRYHGTHAGSDGYNMCCGTHPENSNPYGAWAVACFAFLVAVIWPLVWIIASIIFDPRKSRMRYIGQNKDGVRVSVSGNTTQKDIERLEKELGIGNVETES